MKVLHLIPTLGSGGAERQLFLLCRESHPAVEHQVVAVWQEGRWADPLRLLGVRVDCLETSLRDPRLLFRIRRHVAQCAPDVVHCWLPSMNLAGALAAFPVPAIASVRNVDDWKPLFYRLADRIAAPLWKAVICNSWAGADFFRAAAGLASSRVYVVPNGVERPAAPAPERGKGDARTICTASRMVRQKRVDRILALAGQLPGFRFLIAGDGPELPRLRAAAPANVVFLGEVADLTPVWAAASVFVLASEREGMSNSLLEAMQAGCVPVITNAGDNARIVEHGVSGYVVEPGRMAAAVQSAAAGWPAMTQQARRAAAAFSIPAMADKTLQVYRSVSAHAPAAHAHPIPRLH